VVVVGWLLIALAVWLIDSAVRNRPPIQTLKGVIGGGTLIPTGTTTPSGTGTGSGTPDTTGPPATHVSGTVSQWIDQAAIVLQQSGTPASQINKSDIAIIIMGESGGNPTAQNNTDSNAAAGHPSKGLMQTIIGTFNEWAVPGHTDVWNPVDNIVAATRYALARYHGNLDNVPGVIQVHNGQRYTAGY
jgi:hypothetical protein